MRIKELMEDGLRLYDEAEAAHRREPSQQTRTRMLVAAAQVWGAACAIAAILHHDDVDGHQVLARYGARGRAVSQLIAAAGKAAEDGEIAGEIVAES